MTSPCPPHRYRIAAPDQVANPREGLPGVCVRCGETRVFKGPGTIADEYTRRDWVAMKHIPKRLADEEVEA